MKIEFENTFVDILRFNASHQFRSVSLQVLYILLFIFMFYAEYTVQVEGEYQSSLMETFLTASLWYVGLWIFQFVFNVFYLYSRRNKSVLTNHVVELQSDSFYEETPYNRSYFYWNGLVKVIRINGFIAIYVTPHMAVIVPNRAFSDKEQRDTFYNSVMERMKNA